MLTRKEALNKFGSDYRIRKLVHEGKLYQLDRGIYSEKKNVPELAVIFRKYPRAVLTLDSAFYFHGLTDVVPEMYELATDRNAPKISDRKIRQYFVPREFFCVGAIEVERDGYKFRVYSLERMLVELLRFQTKLPFDYYKEILLNYRRRLPQLNIQKIQDYALAAPNSHKVFQRLQMEVL